MLRLSHTVPLLVTLILLWPAGSAAADPLDQVSGTEDWDRKAPEDPAREWNDWLRARRTTRSGRGVLRQERLRNHHLAVLMRASGQRPDFEKIRRIMRAQLIGEATEYALPDPPAAPPPAGPPAADPRPPAGDGVLGVRSSPRRVRPEPRSTTPQPPPWVRVPVERLDRSGQAIDDEGDHVLDRAVKGAKP